MAPRPRPAWLNKPTATPSFKNDDDMFNRSSQTLNRMQQEHDRRRVKTPQRSKNFESQKQDKSGEDGERHFKRRRLSSQDHNPPPETDGCDEFDELVKGRSASSRGSQSPRRKFEERARSEKTSKAKAKVTPSRSVASKADPCNKDSPQKKDALVIDLGDSDASHDAGGLTKAPSPLKSTKRQSTSPDVQALEPIKTARQPEPKEMEDIEISLLARKAQERKRREAAETEKISPRPFSPNTTRPFSNRPDPKNGVRSPPAPREPEPQLSIFLHSSITDTNPLIANIRLSQRLAALRNVWCRRQAAYNFEELYSRVFLVWRGKRLYDSTTCRSMGVSVDGLTGEILVQGLVLGDGLEDAKLELEAMTDELFRESQRKKEQDPRPKSSRLNGRVDEAAKTQEEPPKPSEKNTKIILKSRGYEEYRLLVKPTTKFSQIIQVFRKVRRPPGDKTVFLMFDGERLDDDGTVQESEMEDMDNIEVHVK